MPRLEMSQTLCLASKATAASLACPKLPPPLVVMPGRKPLVQVAPRSPERAQPMFEEPPPETRPTWKAETMVLPNAYVSGSTSLWCCACASVYGSVLTVVSATLATAGVVVNSRTAATAGMATAARDKEDAGCMGDTASSGSRRRPGVCGRRCRCYQKPRHS